MGLKLARRCSEWVGARVLPGRTEPFWHGSRLPSLWVAVKDGPIQGRPKGLSLRAARNGGTLAANRIWLCEGTRCATPLCSNSHSA